MSEDITITLPKELGDYVLSVIHGDLAATKRFLAKEPFDGGPEHPDEFDEAVMDRKDGEAAVALFDKAMGYSVEDRVLQDEWCQEHHQSGELPHEVACRTEVEDHLRDCEAAGSSPLCEDYDC